MNVVGRFRGFRGFGFRGFGVCGVVPGLWGFRVLGLGASVEGVLSALCVHVRLISRSPPKSLIAGGP